MAARWLLRSSSVNRPSEGETASPRPRWHRDRARCCRRASGARNCRPWRPRGAATARGSFMITAEPGRRRARKGAQDRGAVAGGAAADVVGRLDQRHRTGDATVRARRQWRHRASTRAERRRACVPPRQPRDDRDGAPPPGRFLSSPRTRTRRCRAYRRTHSRRRRWPPRPPCRSPRCAAPRLPWAAWARLPCRSRSAAR